MLADFQKLAETWGQVEPEDLHQLRGANRTYLVHPIGVGGAFHAKTVFLANGKEGVLLTGSGNLGVYGMERGNEVYARYDSRQEADSGAFAAWRSWITDIIEHAADSLLSERWADVLGRAPWLSTTAGPTTFVTNWRRPLLEQVLDGLTGPVEALWLTAPFYDRDLGALREILHRSRPRRVNLFLGRDTSVHGARLQILLRDTDADVTIQLYEPRDYVHAKLVGVFTGLTARLLTGSANLSAPALLHAVAEGGHVNAEAGTLVELPASRAEAMFLPPDHVVHAASDELLLDLSFQADTSATETAVRLYAALRQENGLVTVSAKPDVGDFSLTDGANSAPLIGSRAQEPWPEPDGVTLVWLTRASEAVSNRVPLADARALRAALNERTTPSDRPADLDALDAQHPLGRLLADLHQTALFDINEHPATKRIDDLRSQNPNVDHAFWDRLNREQLAQDPRLDRYLQRAGPLPLSDELSWLLDQMLARVPEQNVLRLIQGGNLERDAAEGEGVQWSTNTRLAVRAYNVLHRWSLAIADPRVRWLSDLAPVRHYELLLATFAQIRVQQDDWVPIHRQTRLLETLLGTFLWTERAAGYLPRLSDDERDQALAALLAGPGPSIAAGLAYLALHDAAPATFFGWQPFLVPGIDWGVLVAADQSAQLVASASRLRSTVAEIQTGLEFAASYIDDAHWCVRRARDLGFERITLSREVHPLYPVDVRAIGAGPVLTDPRLVTLLREVLAYVRKPALRLTAGADVLALAVGQPLYGRVGGREFESDDPITIATLSALETAGHALGALLVQDERPDILNVVRP